MTVRDPLPQVVAVRAATNLYTIRSETGGEIRVGGPGTDGAFTPGELLQAALAACVALSADAQLASKLGNAFDATVTVDASRHPEENRVESLKASVAADMSHLSAGDQDKLIERTERIVERLCAVKRSLNAGIESTAAVEAAPRQHHPSNLV